MSNLIKRTVVKLLRKLADKIDSDTCELTEEQAMEILSTLGHKVLSKASACEYLNISRSKFDSLVADGILPKGRKRKGFKELVWFEDEISNVLNKSIMQK